MVTLDFMEKIVGAIYSLTKYSMVVLKKDKWPLFPLEEVTDIIIYDVLQFNETKGVAKCRRNQNNMRK